MGIGQCRAFGLHVGGGVGRALRSWPGVQKRGVCRRTGGLSFLDILRNPCGAGNFLSC